MPSYAALAHTTWVAGYDMTTDANQTVLKITREPRDTTVFGQTSRSRIAGLENVTSSVRGLMQVGTGLVDPTIFAALGGLKVVTQTPAGVETERAYLYQCLDVDYQLFAQVGDVAPFSLALQGRRGTGTSSVGAVGGYLGKAKGDVSSTGVLGTFKQLGAVSASQFLYASFHIFTAGTTITVIVESDDNSGFTTPTTRATIGPLTTTGGTWMTRVAGPLTDNFFRFNVSAVTGTFNVAAAFGIK